MLSSSAFNAFLKTLEEPPSYAIFILATTEKHKILPTILSRCQIFDFKRISLQDTVDHLAGIAVKENIQAEETALQLISQKSEGCMRDALSILDKIVSFTNGEVTYDNAIEHLNILDADYYFKITDCMLEQDLAGAMLLYDDINKKGFEGDMVLNGFAEFLRNVLICTDERVVVLLEVVESFKKRYAALAQRIEAGYLISALNILNESEIQFRAARNKRLHVELALIKLCYLKQALQLTAADGEIEKSKVIDKARSVAFKNIAPIVIKSATTETIETKLQQPLVVPESNKTGTAKLIIDTKAERPMPVFEEAKKPHKKPQTPKKLGSLEALHQKFDTGNNGAKALVRSLEQSSLQVAWNAFIEILKLAKNPAWQSFQLADLHIKDASHFDATASNNLQQKFLELERNKACEFLQKELSNGALQFSILLVERPKEGVLRDVPLSSKEQYQKIVEQYPLVKELKDRLRLELDY